MMAKLVIQSHEREKAAARRRSYFAGPLPRYRRRWYLNPLEMESARDEDAKYEMSQERLDLLGIATFPGA